ncbi:hypothetical protein SKAU_G00344790, partial [Synaphobranchus kaupii]
MANGVNLNFHSQLRSIVDTLAMTAVKEISCLVDDGFAILHLEISRSLQENEALKCKMQTMELQIARGCVEESGMRQQLAKCRCGVQNDDRPVHPVFGNRMDIAPWTDGEPTVRHKDAPTQPTGMKNECADMEERRTEALLIKEERVEEDRDPQGEMNTREERAVESWTCSREKRPVQENFMFGRTSQPGAFLIPEVGETEAENSTGPYGPVTDSENLSVELIDITSAVNGCTSSDTHFITSEGIPTHCNDVTRKKWFVCKYCGKNFSRRNVLEKHHRVHTGEKPFSCLLCEKKFSDSSNLKKHQNVHTGEKPFRCAHCGKRFSDPSSRKRHQTVHTGKQPFRCAECGKRFMRSCHLKRHCQ